MKMWPMTSSKWLITKCKSWALPANWTIIADPTIMAGDCEVEWADGGIGRNLRSAIRQVDQLLEDHFAHVPESDDEEEEGR